MLIISSFVLWRGVVYFADIPIEVNIMHCIFFNFFLYRAIVFVVDSVAFQREMKDVAEFLYQLLTDNTILKNAPPLLIACNKQGKAYHL